MNKFLDYLAITIIVLFCSIVSGFIFYGLYLQPEFAIGITLIGVFVWAYNRVDRIARGKPASSDSSRS